MRTPSTLIVLLVIACPLTAIAQDATTRPAEAVAAPATQPESSSSRYGNYRGNRRFERRSTEAAAPAAPAGLPVIYNVVAARNIFIKGDQRPPPVDTNPRPGPTPGPIGPTASQLVLTGVSLEDNAKVAFLEDQSEYTSTRVKIGDQIANGKVVNISLDALDYKDRNGNIIRVTVGFNLAGGDVWGVANSPTVGSSTQPALTGPRAPGESMEDYLKRRRAAELGH
jgi:hypothetical protein